MPRALLNDIIIADMAPAHVAAPTVWPKIAAGFDDTLGYGSGWIMIGCDSSPEYMHDSGRVVDGDPPLAISFLPPIRVVADIRVHKKGNVLDFESPYWGAKQIQDLRLRPTNLDHIERRLLKAGTEFSLRRVHHFMKGIAARDGHGKAQEDQKPQRTR